MKVKYIIVGQGLAGTLLSWQLIKRKIPHVVVASQLKQSASLVAAGMFNPLVFKRISKSWKIDQLLPVMTKTFVELEEALNEKLLFRQDIAKLIRQDEIEWWNERVKSQELDQYFDGFHSNDNISGVNKAFDYVRVKNAGFIDLVTLIHSYRNKLKDENIFIEGDLAYEDIDLNNSSINWQGITAERIVFCNGVHNLGNPLFNEVVFYPTRGDVLDVYIEGLSEEYTINKDIFLLPRGKNKFLIGSTYDHKNIEWEPNMNSRDYLLLKASQIIDKPIKLIDHRAGVRPTIKDRRPVLGFSKHDNRAAIFNGLGTKGVMLGPYFSVEMINMLENSDYKVDKEVSVERFY